jgi:hypothetical protein
LLAVVAVLALLIGGGLVYRTIASHGNGPPQPPSSAARPLTTPSPPSAPGDPVHIGVRPDGRLDVQPDPQPGDGPGQSGDQARVQLPAAPMPLPPAAPVRIVIPKIAVDTPFVGLSLEPSGRLAAPDPDDRNLAGWYQDGVSPGSRGTAIVAAHVDTHSGPAAFYRLGTLRPGDTADIVRADGMVATFRIDSVEVFAKKDFPSDRVYADAPDAQLRLITCGGAYDKSAGGYQSNVVAFATLTATRPA